MSELTEAEKRNLLRQRRLAKAKNGADRLNKITGLNQSYKEPESPTVSTEPVSTGIAITTGTDTNITSTPSTSTGTSASTPTTPTAVIASTLSQLIDDPDMMDISSFAHEHEFKNQPQVPTESQEDINYRNDIFAYVEHKTKRIDSQFFVLRFVSYLVLLSIPDLVLKNWILLLHFAFQFVSVVVMANLSDYKPSSFLGGFLPLAHQFLPPVWAGRLSLGSKLFSSLDLTLTDFSIIIVILGLKTLF